LICNLQQHNVARGYLAPLSGFVVQIWPNLHILGDFMQILQESFILSAISYAHSIHLAQPVAATAIHSAQPVAVTAIHLAQPVAVTAIHLAQSAAITAIHLAQPVAVTAIHSAVKGLTFLILGMINMASTL
jgi:hypothetical protein